MNFYKYILVVASSLTALSFTACERSEAALEQDVVVFAAASTTNAMREIAAEYTAATGIKVVTSFASSSTLAKQIEQGAPADVYISANPKWMRYLEATGRVQTHTRADLLGNRIVLIAPLSSALEPVALDGKLDFSGMLGVDGRLAMGDPAHVPAGIYGKQALEALGLWSEVSNCVAPMSDVRAALAVVERGETPLGVVYATDAALSQRVKVVAVFPADSHPAIVYPVAAVSENLSAAEALIEFLKSDRAQAIFTKYGFGRP